jgi:anti-sigma-K factor RskA
MSAHRDAMDCAAVDALAGAAVLGALDADELRAATRHLETCNQAHTEFRAVLNAGVVLGSTLEPAEPDPSLRARVMASAAVTRQEHRPIPEPERPVAVPPVASAPAPAPAPATEARRQSWFGWEPLTMWRGLAAAAVVVAIALGGWNIGLRQQMAVQDAALAAVADVVIGGQPAYSVTGRAGSGYVIERDGPGATFLVAGLEELPAGDIYELWLLDAAGTALAVGTIEVANPRLAVVALEQDLSGFALFAVTVEAERVDAPTSDPVMLGAIGN